MNCRVYNLYDHSAFEALFLSQSQTKPVYEDYLSWSLMFFGRSKR